MLRFQQIVPSQSPSNHPICFILIYYLFRTKNKIGELTSNALQCLFCFIQILYQLWDNLCGIMWCNGSLSNSPCWHTPSQWWTHTIHGRIAIGYPHFCGPKSPFAGSWILNVPIKYSPYLNLSQEIAFFVLCVFFHLFSLSPARYGCFCMFRLVFAIRDDHQHLMIHRGWLWVNSHL